MRSYLSILSSCAVAVILLSACSSNKETVYTSRTATSPVPERLEADISTNIYDSDSYQPIKTADNKSRVKSGSGSLFSGFLNVFRGKPLTDPWFNQYSADNRAVASVNNPPVENTGGRLFEQYTADQTSVSEANTEFDNNPVQITDNSNVEIFDLNDGASTVGASTIDVDSNALQSYQARDGVTIYPLDGVAPSVPTYNSVPAYNPAYAPAPIQSYSTTSYTQPSYSTSSHTVTDKQLYFAHGSDRLGSGDKRHLRELAEQARGAGQIEVEGFASHPTQAKDTVTSKVLNLKESMNRSFAVSKDLIKRGVPADKIKTVGWGDGRASGDASHDRRVDISVNSQ